MAKLKGKSKAAATAAASNVEGASGNGTTIAKSAPSSEPVAEISKAAAEENAAVLHDDKSEEVVDNNTEEEETENGDLDEPEEVDEVEEEQTKDVLDVKLEEEVDEVEEAKDGLDDKSEEGEDDEADDESEEGDGEEEDAKEEDGIIESIGTEVVPEGEKVEGEKKFEGEEKVEEEIDVKDNNAKGEEDTPNKKLKRLRRRKKTAAASVAAEVVSNDAVKSLDGADKQGTAAAEKKESKMADGMGLVFMCNAKTKQDCFRYKVLGLPASKKEMVAKIYKGMRLFLFDIDLKLMYGIYKAASPGGYNIEPKAFKSAFPAQVRFRVLNDCLPLPEEKFKAAIRENYYGKNKFDCQLSPEQVKKLCKLFQKAGKIPKKKTSGEVIIAEPELPPPARGRRNTRKAVREEPERTSSVRGRLKNREVIRAEPERTSSARGRKRTWEVIRAVPEQISSRGRKRSRHEGERGRRDNGIPRSGDRHRYARREEAYPSPRGGDHLYARRREAYASPPPPRSVALPPPTYAYGRPGDEYYYRRDPPPPQPLDQRDYRRDPPPPQPLDQRDYRREPPPPQPLDPRDYHRAVELEKRPRQPVEYRDAYSSMYREPIPYNEALYMAPASYAAPPPAAGLAPGYAPPAASMAPSAYAPPSASLGPSAYAPSSSLYYRY